LPFKLVSNCPIFVPTFVVPYNKLVDAFIVCAETLAESLPIIFPAVIVPVFILSDAVNVDCLPFKLVSIPDIFVATLLDPYNKLPDAVIVGAVMVVPIRPVIVPESIVPVFILVVVEFNVDCLPFNDVLRLIPPLIILLQVKTLNVKSVVVVNVFCLFVSSCPIFVPTLLDPYNKLVDAVIVGAIIFPEVIVPVVILVDAVNVDCLPFKLVSIPDIFVPTLLDPYNKLVDAVIVGAIIFPEVIVPVVILVDAVNVDCLPFKLVSIPDIFVATLLDPYNKLVDAVIVGAIIFPEVIVPVVILLLEVNVDCLFDIFCVFVETCVSKLLIFVNNEVIII